MTLPRGSVVVVGLLQILMSVQVAGKVAVATISAVPDPPLATARARL